MGVQDVSQHLSRVAQGDQQNTLQLLSLHAWAWVVGHHSIMQTGWDRGTCNFRGRVLVASGSLRVGYRRRSVVTCWGLGVCLPKSSRQSGMACTLGSHQQPGDSGRHARVSPTLGQCRPSAPHSPQGQTRNLFTPSL